MGFIQSVRAKSNTFLQINLFFVVKRLVDIIGSLILLVIFSPLILFISFRIYKKEGRPILFQEVRVGKNKRPFILYTFRTTTIPTRVIRALPPHPFPDSWNNGVPNDFTFIRNDNKIYTTMGLALKKYRLHKLPMLWNVLKGDLSLVGPSPELPEIADYYNRQQLNRLQVKPGLTGLAQISGGSNLSHKEKINYDLQYIQQYSYKLEAKIMYQAISGILKKNAN